VVGQGQTGASGGAYSRGVQWFVVVQDGAVDAQGGPGELAGVVGLVVDAKQPVGDLMGDSQAFGTECGDQHREFDRAGGGVIGGVQYPDAPAVPLHSVTT
jgi:hypothetical protein